MHRLGMDLDQFNGMNPTQVIDKSQSVSVSSLEAGRRAWARLKTWAAREQVQLRDGFEATEFQLSSYLSAVHKQSVADATAAGPGLPQRANGVIRDRENDAHRAFFRHQVPLEGRICIHHAQLPRLPTTRRRRAPRAY